MNRLFVAGVVLNGRVKMANERYKLMVIARHAIKLGLDPLSLAFISPPTKGKTDTKRIFLHNYQDCNEITAMSDTALGDALVGKKRSPVLIIDDPLNWQKKDFEDALRYFKGLYENKIGTPRKTKFNPNDIPMFANISTILFFHSKQYTQIEYILALTGYDERVLMIWSEHTERTMKYISNYYRKHKINTARKRYPVFEISDLELLTSPRELTNSEDGWITDIFGGAGQERTVRTIGSCVSENTFEGLKDALKSNSKRSMFEEDIDFEEGM